MHLKLFLKTFLLLLSVHSINAQNTLERQKAAVYVDMLKRVIDKYDLNLDSTFNFGIIDLRMASLNVSTSPLGNYTFYQKVKYDSTVLFIIKDSIKQVFQEKHFTFLDARFKEEKTRYDIIKTYRKDRKGLKNATKTFYFELDKPIERWESFDEKVKWLPLRTYGTHYRDELKFSPDFLHMPFFFFCDLDREQSKLLLFSYKLIELPDQIGTELKFVSMSEL
jgi:hypothetical protein